MRQRGLVIALLVMIVSMVLAACGGSAGNTGTSATNAPSEATSESSSVAAATSAPATAAPEATPAAPDATATTEETPQAGTNESALARLQQNAASISQELADAFAGEYTGTKVSMTGPFVGPDAERFNEAIQEFEEVTGIDIQYEGTRQFEATISARVDGGNPPDIADFPQPGLAASFAQSGKIVDVTTFIKPEWLQQNYAQSYLDYATLQGQSGPIMAGVWHRGFPKSLVWYPKAAFEAAGYTVPTTWDELTALQDQIVADGDTPWCIGISSEASTGWPATDWTEDIMLRTTSLENYDKWTKGELSFSDPVVKNAVQVWSDIWFNDNYVYGGRNAIVTTSFGDSVQPMFEQPDPKCWLHKQGSFITSFFPPDAEPGVDYDVFYLPPLDPQYGKPVLFSGDLMVMFNDRPEVRAVESFFSSAVSIERWIKAGGALPLQKDAEADWYTNSVDRNVADILQNAEIVRFDGSDLMPGVVGSGTFWKGMTDYIAGTVNLDGALGEIQAGWANVNK